MKKTFFAVLDIFFNSVPGARCEKYDENKEDIFFGGRCLDQAIVLMGKKF